jgi:hypothetical protein
MKAVIIYDTLYYNDQGIRFSCAFRDGSSVKTRRERGSR